MGRRGYKNSGRLFIITRRADSFYEENEVVYQFSEINARAVNVYVSSMICEFGVAGGNNNGS